MAKGTGLVKSRDRYNKLIKAFPEREEFYRAQIADVEAQIIEMAVCRRCGRPLKDPHARSIGYGKECQAKSEAEAEAAAE